MKVIISNFRTYKEKVEYEFVDNTITLLKGVSGSGKSTIFEAISWCLFAGMQHILPNDIDGKTLKTCVILEIHNIIIKRTKPPNILKITFTDNDDQYLDQQAEEFIINKFGSKDLWLSSSYIIQGSRSPLVALSNVKKFELLNELTFGDDENEKTPEYYYNKIDEEHDKIKKIIGSEISECNGFTNAYESLLKTNANSYNNWGNKPKRTKEINNLKKLIIELKEECKMHNEKYMIALKNEEMVKEKNNLNDKLIKHNLDISTINILSLEKKLTNNKNLLKLLTDRNKLKILEKHCSLPKDENYEEKLLNWKNIYIFNKKTKREELISNNINYNKWNKWIKYKKWKDWKEYNNNTNIYYAWCKWKKIEYEESLDNEKKLEINNKINEYNTYIKNKELLEKLLIKEKYDIEMKKYLLYEEWEKNKNILDKYENDIKELETLQEKTNSQIRENKNLENIYKLTLNNYIKYKKRQDRRLEILLALENLNYNNCSTEKIGELELIHKQIYCPFCNNGLRLVNGSLEKGLFTKDEKEDKIQLLDNLKIIKKLQEELNTLPEEEIILEPIKPVLFDIDLLCLDKEIIKPKVKKINQPEKCIKPILPDNYYDGENYNINSLKELCKKEISKPEIMELQKVDMSKIKPKLYNYEEILLLLHNHDHDHNNYDIKILEKVNITELKKKIKNVIAEAEEMEEAEEVEEITNYIEEIPELDLKNINMEIISLQNIEEYNKLSEEIIKYDNNYSHYLTKEEYLNIILELEDEIEELDNKIKNYNETCLNIKFIKDKLSTLNIIEIENSKEIEEKMLKIKSEIDKTKQLIMDGENVINLDKQRKEIEQRKEKIIEYSNFEANLIKLRTIITETSTESMEEILNNINTYINIYLKELFYEDVIYLSLNTHKLLKKGDTKLQINLEIEYNGYIYDNINNLSGGEQDRITFALTLALSKVTSMPFLLLDECMASLNDDLKEICLEMLHNHFSNLTIINICHGIVEGFHNNTILIEK